MKILHTSDLHLGISLLGVPLLPYQRSFCKNFCEAAGQADAVIIAGDVFDTSVASAEAIRCWSELVSTLCLEKKLPVIVCAGNHDGAARLSSCSDLLRSAGLFIAGSFEDAFSPVICGNTAFYVMPYFNPSDAAVIMNCKPTAAAVMEAAAKKILSEADKNFCNILVAHCFAAGAKPAESDVSARASESVGGADQIPLTVFDGFDYVALGHLHRAQTFSLADSKTIIRYSGTPLPYSFSEAGQGKSFTIFDTESHSISEIPVPEEYRLRSIEDTYENILAFAETDENRSDFMKISLTDRYDGDGVYMKLKELYPNLLRFSGKHFSQDGEAEITAREAAELDIISLARRYAEEKRGEAPDPEELEWLAEAFAESEKEATL